MEKIEKPSFAQLWQDIKKHKRLYYKVLPATFIVAAILTLSMPNYYKCTVMLAPELPSSNRSAAGLAALASNFGLNLNTAQAGSDAIMPYLYPDLMNSVAFKASLFPIRVHKDNEATAMTYYDYLKDHQRAPWWAYALSSPGKFVGWMVSLIADKKVEKSTKVDPFRLTKDQMKIVEVISKKVVCDVDKKTYAITIDVTDQDPLIAATIADSIQVRLQDFITDYRTRKARIDLAYNRKIYKEAQQRYEKARLKSAAYNDANMRVFLNLIRSEQIKLENEMSIQFQNYSQVATQLQLAEAKVQQETPAFTLLQPATVPIRKAGPARAKICLVFLFLAFLATSLWIIHHEGHLIPFFTGDDEEENNEPISNEDLLRTLLKIKE